MTPANGEFRPAVHEDNQRSINPQQLNHIGHDELLRVISVLGVDRGAAIAAHIRRHRPEAQIGQAGQLMTPTDGEFRPAVHEDNQRSINRSGREIKRGVRSGFHSVLANGGDGHGLWVLI